VRAVFRRIHEHDSATSESLRVDTLSVRNQIHHDRDSLRRELLRPRRDRLDVVVLGDDPELAFLVPVQRIRLPQLTERRVGIAEIKPWVVESGFGNAGDRRHSMNNRTKTVKL
jgi:hypothetical protein